MPNGEKIRIVPYEKRYEAQVLELAHEMHAESVSYGDMPFDDAKLVQQLELSHTMPEMVYVRLAVTDDEVLGGFFGIISPTFFSDERACKDLAWFVRQDRRGSSAALRLLADFEQWGLDRGARKFFIGESTGVNIEKTARLYEHCGYRITGVNGVKTAIPTELENNHGI